MATIYWAGGTDTDIDDFNNYVTSANGTSVISDNSGDFSGDDIIFQSLALSNVSNNPTVNANETFNSVQIDSGCTLTGNDSYTVTIDGKLGDYAFNHDGTISGDLNLNITTSGTSRIDPNASGNINDLTYNSSGGTLEIHSIMVLDGDLTITAGTIDTLSGDPQNLTVAGDCVVGPATATLTCNNSAVSLGALKIDSSTATVTATSSGTLNITTGSVFGGSSSYSIYNNGGHLNHAGTITISGGSYWSIIGATSTVNDVVIAGGSYYVGAPTIGGNLTINASRQISDYGGTQTLTVDGNVILNGRLKVSNTNPDCTFGSLTINSGGEYDATSGLTTITAHDGSGNARAFNMNGAGATYKSNGGTLKFQRSSGTSYIEGQGTTIYHVGDTIQCSSTDNKFHYGSFIFGGLIVDASKAMTAHGDWYNGDYSITVENDAIISGTLTMDEGDDATEDPNMSFGTLSIPSGGTYNATRQTTTITGGFRPADVVGTLNLNGGAWAFGGTGGNFEGDFLKDAREVRINQDSALYFSGDTADSISDHVTMGDNDLITTGSMTISCWFKPETNTTHGACLIGKQSSYDVGDLGYGLYWRASTQQVYFNVGDGVGNGARVDIVLGSGVIDTWIHVAGTYNSTSKAMVLYVNGISKATATATSCGDLSASNTDHLRLGANGADPDEGDAHFKGYIADARIYTYVSDQPTVARLANKINIDDPHADSNYGMVGWWKCNEGTGHAIVDYHNVGTDFDGAFKRNDANYSTDIWKFDQYSVDVQDNTTTVPNLIVESGQLNTKGLTYLDAFEGSGGTLRDVTISSNILDYAAGDPYTLAFWYKYASGNHGSQGTIISTQTHGGDNGFRMGYNNANFILRNGNSERNNTTTVNSAGWYHVIYTRNTDGTGEWYLNGVNDGDITGFGVDCSTGAESSTGIGRKIAETGGGTTRYLAGSLRDLRIYDNHISADIAASIYRGSYNVTPTHWYKMSDDTGATGAVVDSGTATAANGTGTGLSWANGSLKVNGAARVLDNGSVL